MVILSNVWRHIMKYHHPHMGITYETHRNSSVRDGMTDGFEHCSTDLRKCGCNPEKRVGYWGKNQSWGTETVRTDGQIGQVKKPTSAKIESLQTLIPINEEPRSRMPRTSQNHVLRIWLSWPFTRILAVQAKFSQQFDTLSYFYLKMHVFHRMVGHVPYHRCRVLYIYMYMYIYMYIYIYICICIYIYIYIYSGMICTQDISKN